MKRRHFSWSARVDLGWFVLELVNVNRIDVVNIVDLHGEKACLNLENSGSDR